MPLQGPTDVFDRALRVLELSWAGQFEALGAWFQLPPGGDAGDPIMMRGVGVIALALLALVVIALARLRLGAERHRLEIMRRLVEQGLEPPRELLMAPAQHDLRRGLVLGFAGLGVVIAGAVLGDRGIVAAGLVPAFISAGYLISYRIASEERHDSGGR